MKTEISAGGVVYKSNKDDVKIFVGKHSGHHRWVLPKGWIDPGETKEQTAAREVEEEAGVTAEIEKYLGETTFFYTLPVGRQGNPDPPAGGEKVRKTSHFFLMRYISGDPAKDLGWEMEDFAWLPPKEAIQKLDYPGEKEMVEKASKILFTQKIKGSTAAQRTVVNPRKSRGGRRRPR